MSKKAARAEQKLQSLLQEALQAPDASAHAALDGVKHLAALQALYRERQYEPAWFSAGRSNAPAQAATAALAQAEQHGLDPQKYFRGGLLKLGTQAQQLAVEFRLTDALITYATDLDRGLINPRSLTDSWDIKREGGEIRPAVAEAMSSGDLDAAFRPLLPSDLRYEALSSALEKYRGLAEAGGWPRLKDGPTLGRGAQASQVIALRKRLAIEAGESVPKRPQNEAQYVAAKTFDAGVEKAVKTFQAARGLEPDGRLGGETRRALNVSARDRARQIAVNLERLRWLPNEREGTHIFVDIAAYELSVREQGRMRSQMRVIVGEEGWETPVFSDEITYVVLAPTWTPPDSVAFYSVLPRIRQDPAYLERLGFRVLKKSDRNPVDPSTVDWEGLNAEEMPFYLVQQPGPANPMGPVKFMFPNRFAVYLHGTPAEQLFDRDERALSHGCIRVEKPEALATYLLSFNTEDKWPRSRIEEAMRGQEEISVPLERPMPVHLFYRTAWLDEKGVLQFRPDIYGWDRLVADALSATRGGKKRIASE